MGDARAEGRTSSFSAPLVVALVLCGMVMVIDGYDLSAMPLAVPHIVRQWSVAPASFGIALSAVLLGLGLGAIFVAPLGDRFGRRPMIILAIAGIGVATLATATGTSTGAFAVWRLLTGVTLGACLPNVIALAAELAPPGRRSSILVIVSCGISVGGVVAGFIVPPLVAWGGWQMIFIAPGFATLGLGAVLLLLLPESPKFLRASGKSEQADAVARRLGLALVDPVVPARAGTAPRLGFLAPLRRPFLGASLLFAGLYAVNSLALYMMISWLPTLLPTVGFSIAASGRLLSLVQAGGLVGGLILSWFLDRGRTTPALLTTYGLVIVAFVGFSLVAPTVGGWSLLILFAGGGISAAHLALMAVGSSFFPPRMLSAAIGFAVAVARIGAIGGPLVGGWLVGIPVAAPVYFLAMIVPALLLVALVLAIPAVERGEVARDAA